jgi:hypothetical protein
MATGAVWELFELAMTRTSELMREVNRNVRRRAAPGSDEPISLFCECLEGSCYASVWLTTEEFDAIERDPAAWVVIPGHRCPEMAVEASPWV